MTARSYLSQKTVMSFDGQDKDAVLRVLMLSIESMVDSGNGQITIDVSDHVIKKIIKEMYLNATIPAEARTVEERDKRSIT